MLKSKVFDMAGNEVGEIELNEAIFGVEPNTVVMHEVVKNYLANQRQGTQSTLTRAEVRGGGMNPWRQKGTGRARQGSIRAPQWTHGGIALGPKPRSYRYTLNKKVKRLALYSALSSKVLENQLTVIDSIQFNAPKTKDFVKFLDAVKVNGKALVVTANADKNTYLSGRNIPGVKTTMAATLNVYDLLKYDNLIVDKASLAAIEEVFA